MQPSHPPLMTMPCLRTPAALQALNHTAFLGYET